MRGIQQAVIALALSVMLPAAIAAQGVQTGEVSGVVSSSDGLSLPGATVTVQSASLQGTRTAVTDANGAYVVRALPPGTYKVTFEMAGLTSKTETAAVELGRQTNVNAVLAVAGMSGDVQGTAGGKTPRRAAPNPRAHQNPRPH